MHQTYSIFRWKPLALTLRSTACLLVFVAAGAAQAAYVVTFAQVGTGVVGTGNGSINLGGLTFVTTTQGSPVPGVDPLDDVIALGPAAQRGLTNLQVFTDGNNDGNPSSFGNGGYATANAVSGTTVTLTRDASIGSTFFYVPLGYVSGAPLGLSMDTFLQTTIDALGLTPGTTVFSFGRGDTADTFSIIVPGAVAAVPEPASVALFALGIFSISLARRRRARAIS